MLDECMQNYLTQTATFFVLKLAATILLQV